MSTNTTELPQVQLENPIEASNHESVHVTHRENPIDEEPLPKTPKIVSSDIAYLERDPGKRKPIWEYKSSKEQNEIRRAFLSKGPYTWNSSEYPFDDKGKRFCSSWFKQFPNWLEYSPTTNKAYCLPCFLYAMPSNHPGQNAFTTKGFCSWKKVNDGVKCAFLGHIGKDHNSRHNIAIMKCVDLMKTEQHIDTVIDNITPEIVERNRLRLMISIFAVKWLTFQHCPLRGHDESLGSLNKGNFLEFVDVAAFLSKDIAAILESAPGNATYTAPSIQKEILTIYAGRIRDVIRREIGDKKFCIIVDETKDLSKKEQMAIVLRFVDDDGFIQERLFDLVHVSETNALTLKIGIQECLELYKLNIENIRGQGYDGASNMRGEWSGLQALFLNECPYAYYVHCFAHRLQLALVAASRDVISIQKIFSKLTLIVNLVTSSSKRHDQLQAAHIVEIERLIELEDLETGKGQNQVGTVKRAGDTRWGSHLGSLHSFLTMYQPSRLVLLKIIKEGKGPHRGEADKTYDDMTSFEFVLILHIMIQILGITNDLCQALQRKSQDILNAMHLVSNTKTLMQNLRDNGWDNLLEQVVQFCNKHEVEVPDMEAHYTQGKGRYRQPKDRVTNIHYFRVEVFFAAVDSQLLELNYRFKDDMVELLSLSSSLDPKRKFQNFKIDDICKLVEKFYPVDFTSQEKVSLKFQLQPFIAQVKSHPEAQNLKSISALCQWLATTGKSEDFYLVDRLIRLVLTLPVSTATAERAFSAMKLIKTTLRNRMDDDYLSDSLIMYVEKQIIRQFDMDSLIDEFASRKGRRALFKTSKKK